MMDSRDCSRLPRSGGKREVVEPCDVAALQKPPLSLRSPPYFLAVQSNKIIVRALVIGVDAFELEFVFAGGQEFF